jgi:hypothetical protein
MTLGSGAARTWLAVICGIIAGTSTALSDTSVLSNGVILRPAPNETWAVYTYDPGTSKWTELDNIRWQEVTSLGHDHYVIEATAPWPTTVSTYRVVMEIVGSPFEVFMTPDATQRLTTGEIATLRINLF